MKKVCNRNMLFTAALFFQLNAVAAFGQTVVKGSVKDNTVKPVSGEVVTDGAHFKTTDAQGNYVLNTDPARYPMVYISTPADYELPSKEGVADSFYQYLDAKHRDSARPETDCRLTSKLRNRWYGAGRPCMGCHELICSLPASRL